MGYEKQKEYIVSHFARAFEKAQNEHQAVDSSEVSHSKRLHKILEVGDLQGKSVLDVGCGLGALYGTLKNQKITCDYAGIDITPAMITNARERYPEIKENFQIFDILQDKMNRSYDYVLSVSPMNLLLDPPLNMDLTIELVKQMFDVCRLGIAISMTSFLTERPQRETFYYDPVLVLSEVFKISKSVSLDHTYLPHDFTIFCYKRDLYTY